MFHLHCPKVWCGWTHQCTHTIKNCVLQSHHSVETKLENILEAPISLAMKQNFHCKSLVFTRVIHPLPLAWEAHQMLWCLTSWAATGRAPSSLRPVGLCQQWHLHPWFPNCSTAWSHPKVVCCHKRAQGFPFTLFGHDWYQLLTLSSQDHGFSLLDINGISKTVQHFYWSPQLLLKTKICTGGEKAEIPACAQNPAGWIHHCHLASSC